MTNGAVLILGARSDIGLAIAHKFAKDGHPVQLALRDPAQLETAQKDLNLRYNVPVTLHAFDALAVDTHAAFIDELPKLPQIAVCAVGLMGDQIENEQDVTAAVTVMRSNYEGPASILALLANRFDQRGSGQIVGISSVAGLRGRATNYVYGSAKAGFTAFLSGLRNRMASRNVHVLTVLPGFVATRMTEGMDLPARLTAAPEEVAQAIARGLNKGRNVIYVRSIWRLIMTIIVLIPETIFKKLRI
ncbi:short-chain dehydrogenase [Ruegeria sp. ANG-R]|uniref:SDR family oxidoreductase n=1 Tax=Ruegeria sp. ANG-R TaxID=1577903 RepID=UPI00057D1F7D|nr:SDR family oxidoreductase [Ruegeria sp. ANG-R]KIC41610.1 short-chain dehydrogenase [Ruegeria sp. ANG-R]